METLAGALPAGAGVLTLARDPQRAARQNRAG